MTKEKKYILLEEAGDSKEGITICLIKTMLFEIIVSFTQLAPAKKHLWFSETERDGV